MFYFILIGLCSFDNDRQAIDHLTSQYENLTKIRIVQFQCLTLQLFLMLDSITLQTWKDEKKTERQKKWASCRILHILAEI